MKRERGRERKEAVDAPANDPETLSSRPFPGNRGAARLFGHKKSANSLFRSAPARGRDRAPIRRAERDEGAGEVPRIDSFVIDGFRAEVYTDSEDSGTDDSDEDIVTDYLADELNGNGAPDAPRGKALDSASGVAMSGADTPALGEPDEPARGPGANADPIPTISVTQHSPAASKAFFILGNQLDYSSVPTTRARRLGPPGSNGRRLGDASADSPVRTCGGANIANRSQCFFRLAVALVEMISARLTGPGAKTHR